MQYNRINSLFTNRLPIIRVPLQNLSCSEITQCNKTYTRDKNYSTETLVCSFQYFALSRAAFNRLREDFELPSVRALTRLTSKVKTTDNSSYIKHDVTNLNEKKQKICLLLLDEVYEKATFQYHCEKVF